MNKVKKLNKNKVKDVNGGTGPKEWWINQRLYNNSYSEKDSSNSDIENAQVTLAKTLIDKK